MNDKNIANSLVMMILYLCANHMLFYYVNCELKLKNKKIYKACKNHRHFTQLRNLKNKKKKLDPGCIFCNFAIEKKK